ncbi:MAG: bacillithiol biosynthesis deacetylase BshB1 [candidate division Zixibacteria bacterium]|nr:bacillithiol biosynthesis deacetylase BshB1 [candidate division Zixibacteria bacterium]
MADTNYDVLAIGAHPDDVEVGCGGTLCRLVAQGHSAAITFLTEGEMGTGGNIEIRRQEARDAAKIMGVYLSPPYDWGDTQLTDTYQRRVEIAQLIRRIRPKILLCPYPQIATGRRQSHPDHVATGVICLNAVNIAALKKLESELEPHRVMRVFHYFLPQAVSPSFVVDITDYYERWMDSLKAHRSQFQNPDKDGDYLFYLETMSRAYGQMARCKYGQGFYSAEPVAIDDLLDLVKVAPQVIPK